MTTGDGMRINDLFYLLDKKILIMDVHDGLSDASKRQLALAGASIIGPLSNVNDVLLAIALHEPDAVIIEARADERDIVQIARRFESLKVPFIFASISTRAKDFLQGGFNLNGDVEELRNITHALFLKPVKDDLH